MEFQVNVWATVKILTMSSYNLIRNCLRIEIIQGVFEVEAFLLTCDSMRCSKEF
jgi:hypothetical protein